MDAAVADEGRKGKSSPSKLPHRRPLPFLIHSLLGLKLSILLGFVCLTGTIATVSYEIEWLLFPEVRGSSNGQTDEYGRMWGLVRKAYPHAYIQSLGAYDRSDSSYFARQADIVLPDGTSRHVFVDAGRMTITGEGRGNSFHSIMRGLHYYLLLPGEISFYLITSLGFVLAASVITGFLTYKKFWRGFFRMPRWRRSTRTWNGDLHRLMALWSLWFMAIIAATAIWYLVEALAPSMETPAPRAAQRQFLVTPKAEQIDRWVSVAKGRFPGLSITYIQMPYVSDDPVIVQGQWRAWLVRERTNALFIDPASDRVLGARDAEAMGLAERWVHTADPLHFGNFGGLVVKLIWVIFGIVMTGLSATGLVIFTKRTSTAVKAL